MNSLLVSFPGLGSSIYSRTVHCLSLYPPTISANSFSEVVCPSCPFVAALVANVVLLICQIHSYIAYPRSQRSTLCEGTRNTCWTCLMLDASSPQQALSRIFAQPTRDSLPSFPRSRARVHIHSICGMLHPLMIHDKEVVRSSMLSWIAGDSAKSANVVTRSASNVCSRGVHGYSSQATLHTSALVSLEELA